MKLNFNLSPPKRNESTNLAKPVGGKLLIHQNRFVASSKIGGFFIRPGECIIDVSTLG